MAITYFGAASTPADNGTNTADPTAITPPGSMVAGDLVFIAARASGTTGTASISQAGGQSWTALTQRNATQCRTNCFYCRYNGTWSANPSVAFSSTTNNIAVMWVFRPTSGSNQWAVDVAETSATYTAPTTPFTVTITGKTTLTDGALVVAIWTSADDNTWGSLTAGWTVAGGAQYRNTSGTNQGSVTGAYLVKSPAGATGNVAKNQATLGGDAGTQYIIVFKEYLNGTATPAGKGLTTGKGTATLIGDALKVASGKLATTGFGNASANGGTANGTATPAGIPATTGKGTAVGHGDALKTASGRAVGTTQGTATEKGDALKSASGKLASTGLGTVTASGAAPSVTPPASGGSQTVARWTRPWNYRGESEIARPILPELRSDIGQARAFGESRALIQGKRASCGSGRVLGRGEGRARPGADGFRRHARAAGGAVTVQAVRNPTDDELLLVSLLAL